MTTRGNDVVDVLTSQHERLAQQFALLTTSVGDARRMLFAELVRLAHAHEVGERAVVYPVVRDTATGGATIAVACMREADHMMQAFAELKDLTVAHPAFDVKLAVLRQAFLDHKAHEERDEFPRLRQYVPRQSLYVMAAELRDVQAMG
jgi:hypothetical protein